MTKTLDKSLLDRKNILNNPFALEHIQQEVGISGLMFENSYILTAKQVAGFFEVDEKTIDRYISEYNAELKQNGYEVISGKRLQEFKGLFGKDINVPTKTTVLGIFSFKAFLDMGMLLKESEKARILRSLMLDIVLDVVSKKAGGSTKFINQRDEEYLIALYEGENYKKEFIEALKRYVDMGNIKYPMYTDKIYNSIFKEHAKEYKNILKLDEKDKVRDTLYSEVLTTISMYESGLAEELKKEHEQLGRKLTTVEVDTIFKELEKNRLLVPYIERVRKKMASRDYEFRSIEHPELAEYISPLDRKEFERFLGEKSKELAKRIEENKEIFKRLKDK